MNNHAGFIGLRLDPSLRALVLSQAARENLKISELVRKALAEYITKHIV